MMGKSHLKIGVGVALSTANFTLILASALGSLLPDVDQKNSYIRNFFSFKYKPKRNLFLKHRGFTHSLIALIIVYIFFYCIGTPAFALGISLGYLSHLIADMCTPAGIQILWPYNKKFRIMKIRTNSLMEKIIAYIVLFIGIIKLGGKV